MTTQVVLPPTFLAWVDTEIQLAQKFNLFARQYVDELKFTEAEYCREKAIAIYDRLDALYDWWREQGYQTIQDTGGTQ